MRPGEFPVDVLDSVEDTKGNNGERGKSFLIIINNITNSLEGCRLYKDMPMLMCLERILHFVKTQSTFKIHKFLYLVIWRD